MIIGAAALAALTVSATETIAYWPFGTNGFHDVSGNGHDLMSTTVTESDAGCITLDGTSQFLQTASALDLSGETVVTFECWTKMTAENKDVPLLMCNANPTTGTGGFVIYYGKSTHKFQAQYRMAESGASVWQMELSKSASQLQDGAWHHVAYIVDRSKTGWDSVRLYVDGEEQNNNYGVQGTVPALFNDTFMIGGGASYVAGANFYTGHIDDVRISRGALTPNQFLKFPTVGKAMRADDGKLPVVAYWPFGGKGGADATGNGFDLTMTGVPMTSGTPNVSFNDRNSWVGDFMCTNLPFSAFSTTGVTIEFFAKTATSYTEAGNLLTLTPNRYYYNNAGAFRIGPKYAEGGHKSMQAAFRRKDSGNYAESLATISRFGELNDGKWRHFAVVYDPSNIESGAVTLYVDGIAAESSDNNPSQGAIALLDTTLYFQRVNYGGDIESPYVGSFDDVRITAGVLAPDQFLPSRSAGSTVALYRFDQSSLDDVTGNGNDLVHCQDATDGGTATFGDGGYPDSGTGLVLSGKKGGKEWIRTAAPVDFSNIKAMTVEFDYNSPNPDTEKDSSLYVIAASSNGGAERGGFVVYRSGNRLQQQFRKDASNWLIAQGNTIGSQLNGYNRVRYSVNARNSGIVYFNLSLDGTLNSWTASDTFDSLGTPTLCLGHCPSYGGATGTNPCWMKGKLMRVAVSDVALDPADYVLDNLVLEEKSKRTLAYWDFKTLDGVVATGVGRRGGGLEFNGTSSAITTNLTLSMLTQATVECFVSFGNTPSSGTLLSLGSGVGSFAIASDASANVLAGTFIPYDHLAASNGGSTALAPLAGRKVYHHVALVIDRTKSGADAVRFYVDYQRTMPAGRAWDAAATLLDGAITIGDGFKGRIDDLRVSAGALEPSEFLQSASYVPDGMIISVQ